MVFALTLLLRATARVRVETGGLDVWRATSIRPLRVAWDQIAGLEGGEAANVERLVAARFGDRLGELWREQGIELPR